MITKFDSFINENIFNWNKKKDEYKPSFDYDCKETDHNDLHQRFSYTKPKPFDFEEKKLIALFIGEHTPMVTKNLYEFKYKIDKSIGFGLSASTRRKINVKVTKEGSSIETHYIVEIQYPFKSGTGSYYDRKLFLCGNLKSCFKKIKEVEKSNDN